MALKPDLMTVVVEDAGPESVRFAKPQTILPPPDDWKPAQMGDKYFPITECREPVWECLDLFWECKRNSQEMNAEVYLSCALIAAEALRYQWSRRYVCCFLHCGSMMQLLHFDRSGLVASEALDIEKDTVKFIRCLLGAFCHEPSRLGYPAGKEAPFHRHDSDNKLRQVVTVGGRQLYIDDQEAGPPRDHLVSRATVAFKAKLVDPKAGEKAGWDWCYKSSWPQKLRKHEGDYLERLQDLPNVVDLLVYGVVKIENDNDDTSFGRGKCSSGEPMTLLNTYYRNKTHSLQHTGTTTSTDGPESGSEQVCDNREHRDVVTSWVSSSFDEAISSLDSLSTIFSIWEQAFPAIKAITEKGIVHRDISFRNIRIDDQHKLKVCDFDMAMSLDGQSIGAQDRTGTIPFMATSILYPEPCAHRPIHDCESIFWLCALELLPRVDVGTIKGTLASINGGKDLVTVAHSKAALFMRLKLFKREGSWPKALHSLRKSNDSPLFFCLTALMREFDHNNFVNDYQDAEDGFESRCFDQCIEIIRGEFVAGGFAGMLLSDKGKGKGRD